MAELTIADVGSPARPSPLERLQRRLQALGKVLNHDLPNQLVAVQGLVQLIALEESARLSPDGQEYVRRLGGAATRALDLVYGLKDLARLSTTVEPVQRIALKELAADVTAEITKLSPGVVVGYDFPETAAAVAAGHRPLAQAMVELLRFALAATGVERVRLEAERTPAGVSLFIGAARAAEVAPAGRPASAPKSWESRFEYLLAQELVEIAGGSLRFDDSGRGAWFCILIPPASDA